MKPTIFRAAESNKQAILEALKNIIKFEFNSRNKELNCLEIGSATGQHLAYFAQHLPEIQFQPSDVNDELFNSINSFQTLNNLQNLSKPIIFDLSWPSFKCPFDGKQYDIIYCSNVIHITEWECTIGLFQLAKRCLKKIHGILVIYGPFSINGQLTPQSNVDFDQSLRNQNLKWGIRDSQQLEELAGINGLALKQIINMPKNNKILLFKFKL